jgi:hypothetical protein
MKGHTGSHVLQASFGPPWWREEEDDDHREDGKADGRRADVCQSMTLPTYDDPYSLLAMGLLLDGLEI